MEFVGPTSLVFFWNYNFVCVHTIVILPARDMLFNPCYFKR